VHCSIGTVRRSSFRVQFEMRVAGRLAAEGYGVLVGFDYVNQQAAQLPESLRERLEREADGEETTSGGTEGSSAAAG
jgi:acyl-CoA thioester hydrolase